MVTLVNGIPVADDDTESILADAEFDDNTESPALENDSELSCQVCGEALTYGGRGRKPLYCDVHRKTKSASIKPDRAAGGGPKYKGFQGEAQLRTALQSRYFALSGMVGMLTASPANAMAMRAAVDEAVEADIEFARTNATFKAWLEGGVEKSAAAAVVIAHVKMFGPVVIGERNKRMMKAPAAPVETAAPNAAPFRPRFVSRPNVPNNNPQSPPPQPTDNYYPAESEAPSRDSVNAGLIPGMPGL